MQPSEFRHYVQHLQRSERSAAIRQEILSTWNKHNQTEVEELLDQLTRIGKK